MAILYPAKALRLSLPLLVLMLLSFSDLSAQSHNRTPGGKCRLNINRNAEGESCPACDAEDKAKMVREREEGNRAAAARKQLQDKKLAELAERNKQKGSIKTQKLYLSNPDDNNGSGGSGSRSYNSGSSASYNNYSANEAVAQTVDFAANLISSWTNEANKRRSEQRRLDALQLANEQARKEAEGEKIRREVADDMNRGWSYISEYRADAEKGNAYAMSQFGYGHYLRRNYNEAVEWLGKALNGGMTGTTVYWLVKAYEQKSADKESAEHKSQVISWYRKAAELGDIKALHEIGQLLRWSPDMDSRQEAIGWFQKAAKLGDMPAMKMLATEYEKRNIDSALYWYNRVIELPSSETDRIWARDIYYDRAALMRQHPEKFRHLPEAYMDVSKEKEAFVARVGDNEMLWAYYHDEDQQTLYVTPVYRYSVTGRLEGDRFDMYWKGKKLLDEVVIRDDLIPNWAAYFATESHKQEKKNPPSWASLNTENTLEEINEVFVRYPGYQIQQIHPDFHYDPRGRETIRTCTDGGSNCKARFKAGAETWKRYIDEEAAKESFQKKLFKINGQLQDQVIIPVSFKIDQDGNLFHVKPLNTEPDILMITAAVELVWKFNAWEPALKDGKVVVDEQTVDVTFKR